MNQRLKLDKELLKKVEDLIDGKNEHLKFTSSFLGLCAYLLSIKPKASKDFEQCLREKLLERHKESIAVASSLTACPEQSERARIVNLHQAGARLKTLMHGVMEMLKGKVFRQPAWKTATIGVLTVVLIIGATVGPPAVAEFFSMRRLQEIVRNCPQIRAAFGEEAKIAVWPVWLDLEREGISKVTIEALPIGDDAMMPMPLMRTTLLATVDLRREKVVDFRKIGFDEWRDIVGLLPKGPLPEIPIEELRGKTHGEFLQAVAPVFLDRVPLAMQAQLFALSFDPDPPKPFLAELPARTTDPGRSYPRFVRPGIWSEIQSVSEEKPGWGRLVGAIAGTGIGWPPIPLPCESLVITYLMLEGRVIGFSWNHSRGLGLPFGIDACTRAVITEPGKIWAKGLHLVRHGDKIEVAVTTSDVIFVDLVYPTMPRMTDERRQKTIEIARSHPLVEEFLGRRAYLAGASYITAQDERGVWYVPCRDKVWVYIWLQEGPEERRVRTEWSVIVNLAEKRVETIRERKIISRQGEGFHEIIEERVTYLYPEIREVELINEVRRIYYPEDWPIDP